MDEPAQPVFSEYGYLIPPGPHKGSPCHIRLHFVEGTISPKYRAQLFMLMEGVIHSFCELLHTDCVQIWIGEVFISNIPEPECTDLCIFISSDSFNNADKHARDEERKVNILYKSGTRLLNIMYTLSCRDDLSRLADDNDEILESVQSLYQDMDKDDLSLDITWTRHPSRSTSTIPYKDTAPIAQALKNYVEQRQQAVQLQRITGTITTLNMEKYSLRLKKKDGTIITVKFEKENISDLMDHQVNPLYQKEYTIYVICENKPQKKNIYRFRQFEN